MHFVQTRCPHCRTLYQITESQLRAASGQVRCCCCDSIFNAKKHRTPDGTLESGDHHHDQFKTGDHRAEDGDSESDLAAPADKTAFFLAAPLGDDLARADVIAPPVDSGQTDRSPTDALPYWVEESKSKGKVTPRHTFTWTLVIAVLVIIALAQLAWFSKQQLARQPELRPMVEAWCERLGCDIAPWREPSRFQILDRTVEPEPDHIGALRVQLLFRNQAKFAQPLPKLQLELFDKQQRLAARGVFSPDQYLVADVEETDSLVEPGQSVSTTMFVEDPGENIVGFKFDFL